MTGDFTKESDDFGLLNPIGKIAGQELSPSPPMMQTSSFSKPAIAETGQYHKRNPVEVPGDQSDHKTSGWNKGETYLNVTSSLMSPARNSYDSNHQIQVVENHTRYYTIEIEEDNTHDIEEAISTKATPNAKRRGGMHKDRLEVVSSVLA